MHRLPNARCYTIGGGFTGQLAEVQLWDQARGAAAVKATMHLQLTGHEPGLRAYYRMGAVVATEDGSVVPDFGVKGCDAVVYGDPYGGARRLNRRIGSGQKAIKFSSSELCPVSPFCMYEETLEFRVKSPDAAFDPNNADGAGSRLFTFTYFGKSSQGSADTIVFPAGSTDQSAFQSLDGVWFKATCRVVVPGGVRMMRAFEISDLRGRWGSEATPPDLEWAFLEVRRHRIRLISDAISREVYTDTAVLTTLTTQAAALPGGLLDMSRSEYKVGRTEVLCADVAARLDVAQNIPRYTAEKAALTTKLSGLQAQRTTLQSERSALLADPTSYYHRLRVKHSGMVASWNGTSVVQTPAGSTDNELFRWQQAAAPNSTWINLICKTGDLWVTGDYGANVFCAAPNGSSGQLWAFIEMANGVVQILSCVNSGRVFTVNSMTYTVGERIIHYPWESGQYQQWTRERTTEMVATAKSALATKDATLAALEPQINATQQRIDWLTLALASTETVASLQTQLTAAQTSLTAARAELATKNTAVMTALTAAAPLAMPPLATDERDLTTTGAVLDFASPLGRVALLEGAEGNVLLSFVDAGGRLRVVPYDTALDSRNPFFEQWLPDGARACADLRDSGDKITLVQPLTLPTSGWTCEAFVQYPLATRADGSPYTNNVVLAAETRGDAPLVVTRGNRLGVMADGWFFDSGADLSRLLTPGWHHLAAATLDDTSFYADGVKLGSTKGAQPALRLGGAADYIEVPAYASPTAALTVSVWARSTGPTWNKSGNLVAKRDAFIMHPIQNMRDMQFYVFVGAWKCVNVTLPDIQGWHLYTGTYDGANLLFFVDGELRATLALTGAIQADAGVMIIGNDDAVPTATNGPLAGDVAEVSVWSTARSASDIKQDLYRPLKGDEAGLCGYWRLTQIVEGGVAKVKDLTTNARHGIVKGAPLDITITPQRSMDIKVLGNLGSGGCPVGRLSEARLWGLRLGDDEIAASARGALSGNEPGLLGHFPLNEMTGTAVSNRSADAQVHGVALGVDWVGCTAPIGSVGGRVLGLPERGAPAVTCPGLPLAGKSFTVECWARRGGTQGAYMAMVSAGTVNAANTILWLGFTSQNKLFLGFNGNDVESPLVTTDTDWHHFCGTYDQLTKKQRLYCDGALVAERTAPADFLGSATLTLGVAAVANSSFSGALSEVRLWDRARTEAEIRGLMQRRATGAEAGLLCCYPLQEVSSDGKVKDQKTGLFQGQLVGSAQLPLSLNLPLPATDSVLLAEYSTVGVSPEGKKQALMRRSMSFVSAGVAQVLPEQRVEELTLQWMGNTQINPTLLGYIEGAPPVPSENLTQMEDYDGATSVTLSQSEETSYSWHRSEAQSQAFTMEGFVGVGWEVEGGIGIQTKLAEGKAGLAASYETESAEERDTSVTATSSLATSDNLALTGLPESEETFPMLGTRWVPKNVGYALVLSGMADVFVTKLKRSGRMVSYDIRPVEGVPLDVNTITFMLNPAYTLNGTLDGLVGQSAADEVFYAHVPEMRAQYGSLYPASYFRLKEAYALKEAIDRQDKERESFFYNYQTGFLPPQESTAPASVPTINASGDAGVTSQQKQEAQDEAAQRQGAIATKHSTLQSKVRAGAAFADWQARMAHLQTSVGKRNVVNTYVWDGDGGLRTEQQSFASTVEHTFTSQYAESGSLGLQAETMTAGLCLDMSLMGSMAKTSSNSKTLSVGRSLELTVDMAGVEKNGVTDLQDNPRLPGEKVDRYRFMTFYLEGSTDHFNDFFSYVVDPEWLQGNDEEARSLRQARGAKPNRCWRVLHRVTYVERPTLLKGVGKDRRVLSTTTQNPLSRQAELVARMDGLEAKLDAILAKLTPV